MVKTFLLQKSSLLTALGGGVKTENVSSWESTLPPFLVYAPLPSLCKRKTKKTEKSLLKFKEMKKSKVISSLPIF